MSKPVLLMIMDGWGDRKECSDNAITLAHPENFYKLEQNYPHTLLKCSGKDVGLPDGLMGNSEVGHLNMGSGRVVYQEISRIFNAIEDQSFFNNPEFLKAIEYARIHHGSVHLMGLLSDGGVHSHMEHIYALLELCAHNHVDSVFIHGFLDGRDVGPKSALDFIEALQKKMRAIGCGKIATLGGRYYGMDRDNHWDRIEKAYNAMVLGEGKKAANAQAALENSYEDRVTDEFVDPVVLIDEGSQPVGLVRDGDAVIFFNFRADRARQITRALTDPDLNTFNRRLKPEVYYVCMTQYDVNINAPVAFMPQNLNNTLGEVLSQQGLKQLRIAETEKYAHVTFFFNGGVEEANPGEDRVLIPSPGVATYNLAPEMSAREVTEKVLQELERDYYDVVILNYANTDMVGHTGVLEAAVKAVKTVDICMQQVVDRVLQKNGIVLITADHGNCEMMVSPETGSPFTAHTTSRVPFIMVSEQQRNETLKDDGSLQDIAPTLLSLLNLAIPAEMTGRSLLK